MEQMERMNRLSDFWNWLPAFRVVAETEHLGEASERVFTSSSALSRSVTLLEEALGCELFDRSGRNIRLNESGERFLRYVRTAMRLIDDGLEDITEEESIGDVYLGACRRFGWLMQPLLDDIVDDYDKLCPHLTLSDSSQPLEDLLQGKLDLFVTHRPPVHAEIEIERIGAYENTVCAADEHPLADAQPTGPDAFEDVDFIGPAGDERGDGWPPEVARRVRIVTDDPYAEAQTCRRGKLLAVLPAPFIADDPAGEMTSWQPDFLSQTTLYAVRRRQIVEDDLVVELITRLTTFLQA